MARRKRPENETEKEAQTRKTFETISNTATRGEKASWKRKMARMQTLLETLQPIEDEILQLHARKEPIFDDIQDIRSIMVKECIHPFDYLIYKDDHVVCKFCNKRLSIPNDNQKT